MCSIILNCFTVQHDAVEITVTRHPWSLKITILGTKWLSRKVGAYQCKFVVLGLIDEKVRMLRNVTIEEVYKWKRQTHLFLGCIRNALTNLHILKDKCKKDVLSQKDIDGHQIEI